MKKLGITPGPWVFKDIANDVITDSWVESETEVVCVRNGREIHREILSDEFYENKKADAKLISAAPELYEFVLRVSKSSEVSAALKQNAKKVLAKAALSDA